MKTKSIFTAVATTVAFASVAFSQTRGTHEIRDTKDFLWGIGTAAYQVEGAYQADGKGESNWDYYANIVGLTKFTIGEKQTGNIAINMYDREQYLQDIKLMQELGVNTYRFSLPWSRIIPQGVGAVNQKAIAHYRLLIQDLKDAGIEPFVTMYHFDMPQALVEKGGWSNKASVGWFKDYAKVVFKEFGNEVKHFATFNETTIEFFVADYMINPSRSPEPANVRYAKEIDKLHNELLASAEAIKTYHVMKLGGKIGITFNLAPCIPFDPDNQKDVEAAPFQDELLNRIVLDPVFKGCYPANALAMIQKYNPSFKPSKSDMDFLTENRPDFLGVNFYAPAEVKFDEAAPMGVSWLGNNTDKIKMSNGPVRPVYLYNLLMRLKNDYGNPEMFITENGASFQNGEDTVINGSVNDNLRSDYIKKHISAALKAKQDGANLDGYFVWSGWDNFEWTFGYSIRYGIIYVDYKTQKRTPKKSFYTYKEFLNPLKSIPQISK